MAFKVRPRPANGAPARIIARTFAACTLGVALSSCLGAKELPSAPLDIETSSGAVVTVAAELARTGSEQEKGYMGRKRIPDGTGMLFIYEADRKMYFWMKNTPHALSIAYVDSGGVIREIYDMQPLSLATVESARSVRYALEVPQGWFTRAGVTVGDRITAESLAAALERP